MRIFADHCVHTDIVEALRKIGLKVERAIEVNLEKSSDEEIFNYILKTSQVLLTFDKDFGNIPRFDTQKSAGVVIIYTERISKENIIKMIITFFSKIKRRDLKGNLFIIEPERIRIWPKK
jgi:predicted nuclease of predicted toxin-antitoxin system